MKRQRIRHISISVRSSQRHGREGVADTFRVYSWCVRIAGFAAGTPTHTLPNMGRSRPSTRPGTIPPLTPAWDDPAPQPGLASLAPRTPCCGDAAAAVLVPRPARLSAEPLLWQTTGSLLQLVCAIVAHACLCHSCTCLSVVSHYEGPSESNYKTICEDPSCAGRTVLL